jgi:hypothetical protein
MKKLLVVAVGVGLVWGLVPVRSGADEIPEKYRETVRKGLDYIAKQQFKDGHWGANGDQYPLAMTGLAGMALLMEGSTTREGKYKENIRKAVHWLMERSQRGQRDGLIGNPDHPSETGRYMYGHGFSTLFLASIYGEEDDREVREKLKDILTRAAKYIGNAQSTQGGWFYTSKADGHDQDEGSVTVTQVQALRACKNAGIPVPKDIIEKARKYLKDSTTQNGGVVYSLGRGGMRAPVGGERPPLTAAAIACFFNSGDYKDENVKKWFKYCVEKARLHEPGAGGRVGHDEYTHYYFAQCVYFINDDGWGKMFGNGGGEKATWSSYRTKMFDHLVRSQQSDGSWGISGTWGIGGVYTAAINCTIMQLDKGTLPIYQR